MKYTTLVLTILLPFYAVASEKPLAQQLFDMRTYCNNAWSMTRVQWPSIDSFAVWFAGTVGVLGCCKIIKDWSAARALNAAKEALIVELMRPYVNFANVQMAAPDSTAQKAMLALVINPYNGFLYDTTIGSLVKQLMPRATVEQKRAFLGECWELARQKNCVRTDQEKFREEYKNLHVEIREQQVELAKKSVQEICIETVDPTHWTCLVPNGIDLEEYWHFLLRVPEFLAYEGHLTIDFVEKECRMIGNEPLTITTRVCILKEKKLLKKNPELYIIRRRKNDELESSYEAGFSPCKNLFNLAETNGIIIKNLYHNRHKKLEAEAAKITGPAKVIRDDAIKFDERPHRPWYFYWFTRWISFGKEAALSRAWFIPTWIKTEEKDKTKEERTKEQGQFCERMLSKIGFAYQSYKKTSRSLRNALYEFAWAIDTFKKTEKLHKAEKPFLRDRLENKTPNYTNTGKRGCDALQYAQEQIACTAKRLMDIVEKKKIYTELFNKQVMCAQLVQHGVHPTMIKKFFDNASAT